MSKTVEYKGEHNVSPLPSGKLTDEQKAEFEKVNAPFTHFLGTVELANPLNIDQEAAFEEARADFQNVLARAQGRSPSVFVAMVRAMLPGLFACVEKWHLKDVPEQPTMETWPLRPRIEMVNMVVWLIGEVGKLYNDSTDEIAPNA